MEIKFNSYDELPLNKTTEIHQGTIVVRAVFYKNNKYHPHVSLEESLYGLSTI